MTWDEVCADRSLQDLPYKVETNEWGQVVLTPARIRQRVHQGRISGLLHEVVEEGEVAISAPLETLNGVKVAVVAWASDEFFRLHRNDGALSKAPELCVEVVLAPINGTVNSEKIALYFAYGAKEVWLCDDGGVMTFYVSPTETVPTSRLFPAFPVKL